MNLLLEIIKNGIKYTFIFILFIILSIILSILFMFGFVYYIKLWTIIPNNLHFLLLIILPLILIVGIITTSLKKIFGDNEKPIKKQKIDIVELAKTIKTEIDNGK